jgi:putative FmdB family regulatory protein
VPIYEFVCEKCGRIVERLQGVNDGPPEACPECGGKMAKIMSRNSFQLKGGGWYKDLYSSNSKSEGGGTSRPASDASAAATPSPSTGGSPPAQAPVSTPPPPKKES